MKETSAPSVKLFWLGCSTYHWFASRQNQLSLTLTNSFLFLMMFVLATNDLNSKPCKKISFLSKRGFICRFSAPLLILRRCLLIQRYFHRVYEYMCGKKNLTRKCYRNPKRKLGITTQSLKGFKIQSNVWKLD